MWSSNISAIYAFRRIKVYLPLGLQKLIERELYSDFISNTQLESIEVLGKRIGLDKKEIYAAVPSTIDLGGVGERRRMTLLSALISIIIIIIGSFLFLVLTGNYPPTPTFTYTQGTRYGSISPKDFTNST